MIRTKLTEMLGIEYPIVPVSYTHLRAHET